MIVENFNKSTVFLTNLQENHKKWLYLHLVTLKLFT